MVVNQGGHLLEIDFIILDPRVREGDVFGNLVSDEGFHPERVNVEESDRHLGECQDSLDGYLQ